MKKPNVSYGCIALKCKVMQMIVEELRYNPDRLATTARLSQAEELLEASRWQRHFAFIHLLQKTVTF